MTDLKSKLQELLATKGLMTGAQWQTQRSELDERRAAGEFEIDRIVPGELVGSEEEAFYRVRYDLPLDTPHGNRRLGDVLQTVGEHISLSANDAELKEFDPLKAVFVDTETTGLMGGTGTVTFLVGVGYFADGHFRLDQCFMRDFDDEEPMLENLAERFNEAETIVSYNGKSFDLPLLRTRFIAHRIPFRLEGCMHFDLVHAARRFFKARLGDCSLGNIEREVLEIERHGDVNSSEIPRIWLDYLHTRDAQKLKPVFYHHKMDILSLVTLTARLSEALNVPEGAGFTHLEDRLSLVRLHFRQKSYAEVLDLGARVMEERLDEGLQRGCLELMGFAAKRLKRWDEMEAAWEALVKGFPSHVAARVELAKHCEHRKKDLPKAARLCREALEHAETREALGGALPLAEPLEGLRRRMARIERKLGRARGGSMDLDIVG